MATTKKRTSKTTSASTKIPPALVRAIAQAKKKTAYAAALPKGKLAYDTDLEQQAAAKKLQKKGGYYFEVKYYHQLKTHAGLSTGIYYGTIRVPAGRNSKNIPLTLAKAIAKANRNIKKVAAIPKNKLRGEDDMDYRRAKQWAALSKCPVQVMCYEAFPSEIAGKKFIFEGVGGHEVLL